MRRRLISVAAIGLAIVVGLSLERYLVGFLGDDTALPPVAFDFQVLEELRALPALDFVDAKGRAATLGDFHGRVVLLNLWATWCVPCRREMPALDRLQAALGGADFVVLPLAIDRDGLAAVERFYKTFGIRTLGIFLDQSAQTAARLGSPGIPISLLIDREGREIGRQLGPAAWDSPRSLALLRRLIQSPTAAARPQK